MDITDKIKEILSEEDLKVFEEALEKMINEKVGEKVSLKEEELKQKYEEISEKYVTEEVEKRLTEAKVKLVEDYDSKLTNLEKKVVSKLDSFFDHVIAEQISDQMIEKIAINEALLPVVDGIKKVYSENFIELNSDSSKKIAEAKSKIQKLEKQLSESMAKLMQSEERLEKTATYLLISEKTEGMLPSEKEKVVKLFKDKHFTEVKEKIDTFVGMLKESTKSTPKVEYKKVQKKKILDESVDVNDNVDPKKVVEQPKVVKEEVEVNSTTKIANRYM